jgi:PilZ domain-containing protein
MPISKENRMDERRKVPRGRLPKTGCIRFHRDGGFDQNHGVDCWVRNLSPAGAHLEVASQIGIPDEFVLWIGADELTLSCHVVWRTTTKLGVKFISQQQPELAA